MTVSKRRPQPLPQWLDSARGFDLPPAVKDYSQFATDMVDWWNQLNPSWRRSLTRGLPRPDYTSKSLLSLRKGGQHGLVTVILGLYWWRHGRQSPEDTWLGMVNDVAKTIDIILRPERKRGQKRPSNGGEGNTSSKRTKV